MPERNAYRGQCHCGAVSYSVTTDLTGLGDCNCSRCRRLGWVMNFVPSGDFALDSGEDQLVEYRFNTDRIQHLFCRSCGIESFARGIGPSGDPVVVVNVNCLEGAPAVDRAGIQHFNGAAF